MSLFVCNRRQWAGALFAVLLVVGWSPPSAQASCPVPSGPGSARARVAVIIDDLGQNSTLGMRSVALPGPVALAFLPHRPHAAALAAAARNAGKEVLLHLPLQPQTGAALGPGGLTMKMSESHFREIVRENLKSLPAVHGLNTHMGSLLTRHREPMGWLMEELQDQSLFFVDSYTTPESVAMAAAASAKIPHTRRDVFLDHVRDDDAIQREFERLVALGRQNGVSVGIGHPYPETLAYLETALPQLCAQGVELISLQDAIRFQQEPSP
ncbi:MAG: divergent polysaccharide deacetylase family protein [Pseudomonadota bacterium]|nr:divergent polysaccharide deacetylase family protein [Pseudomonadota bacterium]